MSWHATSWAKAQRTGSPSRKALLLVIADYANAEGVAYPSRDTLSDEAEISVDTVDRAVRDLEEAGLLTVERKRKEQGKQLPNVYRLNFDPAAQRKHLRENRVSAPTEPQNAARSEDEAEPQAAAPQPSRNRAANRAATEPHSCAALTIRTEEQEEPPTDARVAREAGGDFLVFWEAYPHEAHMSEDMARLAFGKLAPSDQKLAVRFAEPYARECRMKGRRVKDAAGWLQGRCFMGYAKSSGASGGGAQVEAAWIAKGSAEWFAWERHHAKPLGLAASYDSKRGEAGRYERSRWPPSHATNAAVAEAERDGGRNRGTRAREPAVPP